MTRLKLLLAILLISTNSFGQSKQRIVVDSDKKFSYSDSSGVTQSYIEHFGDAFPVPDLTTIDGKSISQKDTKNKTVVYNFWFVSCRPCVAEIPALNKLAEKYQTDTTLFIAITFDAEDKVKKFLENRSFAFQIVSLPQVRITSIKKNSFYPFTTIVNKGGKISFALFSRPIGKNPEEEIFNLLDNQMKKALVQ